MLILLAPPAAAGTLCVDSAAGLDDAVRMSDDEPVEIRLVRGEYDIAGTALDGALAFDLDFSVRIVGGYAPGCGSRQLDPKTTVLTSSADSPSFWLDGDFDSGDVHLESLLLRDLSLYIDLGSIQIWDIAYSIAIQRVVFDNASAWLNATDIHVANSIFHGLQNASRCALLMQNYEPHRLDQILDAHVVHSVIADNAGDGLCLYAIDDWGATLANNVFWNNGGFDILAHSDDAETDLALVNNIRQDSDIDPPTGTPPVGSLNQDPLFSGNPNAPYRVLDTSPAVNSGIVLTDSASSQDIDGGLRWDGTLPDRGAYESDVNNAIVLTVTNTLDQLAPLIPGSLRWAIAQSNADSDTNTIRFDIPGGCPRMIDLLAPLPDITDRVIIQGYSQPGSAPSTSSLNFNATICIGVRGDLSDNHALQIPISVGAAQSLNVSGIGFGGFDVGAIRIAGGAGSWIHGNQFGGTLDGVPLGNSAVNVRIGGTSYANLVGGDEAAQRNLIMFGWNAGVELLENSAGADGHDNHIINNFIGTHAGGNAMAANNLGIRVRTRDNVIADNLISGNQTHGLLVEGPLANNNSIRGNRIGLKKFAVCAPLPCEADYALGNIGMGLLVEGGGSDNTISFNTVAYNGQKGIRLFDGLRNRLLGNSVYDNASLGIDLGVAGVNPDYGGGSDQLANHGINAPFIAGARGGSYAGNLTGLVEATSGNYIMQAFSSPECDASGHGEGRSLVATQFIDIPGAPGTGGTVQFSLPLESTQSLQPRVITTTWFDQDGNSSEFSNCVPYFCDTIFRHGFDSAQAERCLEP